MLYSIQSKPNDYSVVSTNIDIPWKCSYVKYYVSSINTKSTILILTPDDYLEFIVGTEKVRFEFENVYMTYLSKVIEKINEKTNKYNIYFNVKKSKILSVESHKDLKFVGGSHRAKLVTGLYNCKSFECEANKETEMPDLPIVDYANKLYLISLQGGTAAHSRIGDEEYTPSILANIDTLILDWEPILVNYDQSKPIKIKCFSESLKYIEMRLVDFMFEPIVLKSPLFITLKIKPSTDADAKYIESK